MILLMKGHLNKSMNNIPTVLSQAKAWVSEIPGLHLLDQLMLIFHLGDTYFFWNELVKSQATSEEEALIMSAYLAAKNNNERKYCRMMVGGTILPYIWTMF